MRDTDAARADHDYEPVACLLPVPMLMSTLNTLARADHDYAARADPVGRRHLRGRGGPHRRARHTRPGARGGGGSGKGRGSEGVESERARGRVHPLDISRDRELDSDLTRT